MLIPSLIASFVGTGVLLLGQSVDHADPIRVANYALGLIRVGDVDGLLEIMAPDLKKGYIPFTPEKREELQGIVHKDRELIGKFKEVTEIRECTTVGGKPGVAGRIWKKSGEVFVIILVKEDNLYYYESLLTMTAKAYKDLNLIKKTG